MFGYDGTFNISLNFRIKLNLTTEERVGTPVIKIHNANSFDIWKPAMKVENLVQVSVQDILESVRGILFMEMNQFGAPMPNGPLTGVMMNLIMHVTFSCEMNFDKFPFDSQICIFNVSF
jgi:hypothetical protein